MVCVDRQRCRPDNEFQYRAQRVFRQVLADALDELGLDRGGWVTSPGGDGALAVLAPVVWGPKVVGDLVFAVDRLLATANKDRPVDARVRARIAIHEGPVHLDGAPGFPGSGVTTVVGLIDTPAVEVALRDNSAANVVLIVSGQIYQNQVLAYGRPRPDRFARVEVAPDSAPEAWIFVAGEA